MLFLKIHKKIYKYYLIFFNLYTFKFFIELKYKIIRAFMNYYIIFYFFRYIHAFIYIFEFRTIVPVDLNYT